MDNENQERSEQYKGRCTLTEYCPLFIGYGAIKIFLDGGRITWNNRDAKSESYKPEKIIDPLERKCQAVAIRIYKRNSDNEITDKELHFATVDEAKEYAKANKLCRIEIGNDGYTVYNYDITIDYIDENGDCIDYDFIACGKLDGSDIFVDCREQNGNVHDGNKYAR